MKTKALLLMTSFVTMLCFTPAAQASLTVLSLVGGQPANGVNYVGFNSLPLGSAGGIAPNEPGSANAGGVVVSFSPDAQTVTGDSSGLYAAPFISASNGTKFGDLTANGQDPTHYLTSGSNSSSGNSTAAATLAFTGQQQYLGLLWGSVDAYNTLTFFHGATQVGVLTGTDITAAANGDQGVNGTFYVNIVSADVSWDRVLGTSSQYAFEFDNVAYAATAPPDAAFVPEPASLIIWSLLAGGSASLAVARKRRQRPDRWSRQNRDAILSVISERVHNGV